MRKMQSSSAVKKKFRNSPGREDWGNHITNEYQKAKSYILKLKLQLEIYRLVVRKDQERRRIYRDF